MVGGGPAPPGVTILVGALTYEPSTAAALTCAIIFCILTIIQLVHIARGKDWKWALILPIGSLGYAFGFFVRYYATRFNQDSRAVFIVMQVLLVCSPVAFLAFNYILFGRLVSMHMGAKHSLIPPKWVMPIFVASDIITFVIQGGGASLFSSIDTAKKGRDIFLAGLIIQEVSYFFFTFLVLLAHRSIRKAGETTGKEIWWKTLWLLYASSGPIIVRCVYRMLEMILGRDGFLYQHEICFYLLDCLSLFIATAIYCVWWPGWYIKTESDQASEYKLTETGRMESP